MNHILALIAALLASLVSLHAEATAARPNIVFILADDLGWKDVGYVGSSFYRTPNIDRLARDGMRFSQAYSAACVCSPSRGAIYSGKNPARTGLTCVFQGPGAPDGVLQRQDKSGVGCQTLAALQRLSLPRSERTFGDVLTEAGYATAFFGKWHCGEIPGYEPDERGWKFAKGYRVAKAGGSTKGHWGDSYPSLDCLANLPDLKPRDYLANVLTEDDWKLIRFYNDSAGRFLLYDLAADPYELKDRSAEQPDKVRAMDDRLSNLLKEMQAQLPVPNPDYDATRPAVLTRQTALDMAGKKRRLEESQLRSLAAPSIHRNQDP
jgi:arylsulfatase A-like enzyme